MSARSFTGAGMTIVALLAAATLTVITSGSVPVAVSVPLVVFVVMCISHAMRQATRRLGTILIEELEPDVRDAPEKDQLYRPAGANRE